MRSYRSRLVSLCAAAIAAHPAPALPQSGPSSAQMVDALNGVFGAHPKYRANHANGILLTATFTPTATATSISRAPHFAARTTPVLVRFANFGGIPDIGDGAPGAAPYGMSLKFSLPDHRETDLVMHSFNGFPAATAAGFVGYLTAMGQSPAGSPHPTALERYADAHPQAKAFLDAAKPAPASFTTQPYFGVNTFIFTNKQGKVTYGRYRMVPLGASTYLDDAAQAAAPPDYLRKEIRTRLAAHAAVMRLQLQFAGDGDVLDDPSVAWPASRPLVDLGTLTIETALDAADQRERTMVFMPDELPDGIAPGDPMIAARARAYAESLERRLK